MRHLLPSSREIALFALLAIAGAIVVSMLNERAHDAGLAIYTLPLFVLAAVLGLRRNWAQTEDE